MTASLQSPSCIRTRAASTATSSQSTSPVSQNSQSETPFAPAKLAAANHSLLVRVLNRNLVQQREEANMQSLGSDPLLTSLPAGKFHQANITVLEDNSARRQFGCPSILSDQLKTLLLIAFLDTPPMLQDLHYRIPTQQLPAWWLTIFGPHKNLI